MKKYTVLPVILFTTMLLVPARILVSKGKPVLASVGNGGIVINENGSLKLLLIPLKKTISE